MSALVPYLEVEPSQFKLSTISNDILWILVEWELKSGPNSYAIVDSTQVGHSKTELHPGKTVFIVMGKTMLPATVIIISEDKAFLDTELKQLQKMSAINLIEKSDSKNYCKEQNEVIKKRRRFKKKGSSNASLCETSNMVSSLKNVQFAKPFIFVPPMTFDQQTQTIEIFYEDFPKKQLTKLFALHDQHIETQKVIQSDLAVTKSYLSSLQNEMIEMKKMIEKLSIMLDQKESAKSSIVVVTNSSDQNLLGDELEIKSQYDIFEMKNSTTSELEFFDTDTGKMETSNSPVNKLVEMVNVEWLCDEKEDLGNMVSIGNNRTLIERNVLRSIDWKSHTSATRKLLMATFPRQVLATHSLTGKPSPAFLDPNRPVKMQLDPLKIADIIQIVTKYSRIPESVVRNAITTKCSDENKMHRQRQLRKAGTVKSSVNQANKENSHL